MKYNIRGENIEVTDSIREYVEKKIGKLNRYFDTTPTSDVHVNLSVYNEEKQIEVNIPRTALMNSTKEQNTKVNRKSRKKGAPKHIFAEMEEEAIAAEKEENDADGEIEIVRTKRFNLKPMDSEEAILQMDMLGHAFFVFTNAETDDTNVVYKRKDGRYGLIEPMN